MSFRLQCIVIWKQFINSIALNQTGNASLEVICEITVIRSSDSQVQIYSFGEQYLHIALEASEMC